MSEQTKATGRPKSMEPIRFHYCPGCTHSVVHKLIGQVVDDLAIQEKTILIAPVGCAVLAYNYFKFDVCEAAHGRAAAVATGIKRSEPDCTVISYQGDGDLAAIGLAETIHAANRGENITVIFMNNANYGMTGGQMAPTTLVDQRTTTTPKGRAPEREGYPIDMCAMLATLTAPALIARTKVTNRAWSLRTRALIKEAFTLQQEKKGYSFIEILSNCNTNWKMTPAEGTKWIDEVLEKAYPCKTYVDVHNVTEGIE